MEKKDHRLKLEAKKEEFTSKEKGEKMKTHPGRQVIKRENEVPPEQQDGWETVETDTAQGQS